MKLIGINNGKTGAKGAPFSSILSAGFPAQGAGGTEARSAGKEPDALGQSFERIAGAFDHISAALGTVRSIEGLVADARRAMEAEFIDRRKDQGELAALRLVAEQAPLDLAGARQGEAAAKAKLSDMAAELETLRVAHASLETRVRESEGEGEQLKASLAGERKTVAELDQASKILAGQIVDLEADLASARAHGQAADARSRDAEASLASAERARGLLEADLDALRRRIEQTSDELLRSNRRGVELESLLSAEHARIGGLESELAASRDEAAKLARQLDQQSEATASQTQLTSGRLETLQARSDRQEEQIGELARLVDELTARERAALRETDEAKLMRERAEERARLAQNKLAEAEKEAAGAFAARQTAIARAEELTRSQQLKLAELERFTERETALRQALQHLEQRLASERANAEGKINELSSELERERSQRAVAEGSLDAVRKDRTAALARLARYDAGLAEQEAADLDAAKAG